MASLKEKIKRVLNNPASSIAAPVLEIEETPEHKIGGFIVSHTFAGMDQLDRQNKLWNYLEDVLKPEELRNIITLVTVTPDEADIKVG